MVIEIGQVIRAIRRLWWAPLVFALLLGAAGFGFGQLQTPQYSASTQLLVTTQISGESVFSESGETATYVTLVTSGPVLDRVILELGLEMTRADLAELISSESIANDSMIEITVTTDDAELSADIANSLALNMVAMSTDLTLGELQITLDNLRSQSDSLRDRSVVIDSRLEELGSIEDTEDPQVRAEIRQLERERLQVSQTIADLDAKIREINTSLSTASIPVVVTDFANPPDQDQDSSAIMLAVLGVLVGGLLGAGLILFSAVTDDVLRDTNQVVSLPVLGHLRARELEADQAPQIEVLAAKIATSKPASDSLRLAILAPRSSEMAEVLAGRLAHDIAGDFDEVIQAVGVLDNASVLRRMGTADVMVLVATLNQTRIKDLNEMASFAQISNAEMLGTVILEK